MLRYTLAYSLFCYSGVMLLIAFLSGCVASMVTLRDLTWASPVAAFVSVFLAGLLSLVIVGILQKHNANGVICVMAGIIIRMTLIGAAIIIVVLTQQKNIAFYVLCFSIVYYLGMLPVCLWLTIRPQKTQTPN